jgi:hypothetical protein
MAAEIKDETVHQATVTYSDGKVGNFFSRDGEWFFEHRLPDPGQREPMSYERGWLERMAASSASIKGIEFNQPASA